MSETFSDLDAKADLTHNDAVNSLNNKRKRDSLDQAGAAGRPAPGQRVSPSSNLNATGLDDQATADLFTTGTSGADNDLNHGTGLDFGSLDQHQNGTNVTTSNTAAAALHYSMTVPQATELSFQTQSQGDGSDPYAVLSNGNIAHDYTDLGLDTLRAGGQQSNASNPNESPTSGSANKPAVGSEEWHKQRRDNHKEVERRRRETINEGINELAKIVPGCEKNKGSILSRAVQFITQLKENETQNIEKWTLEKLLTEQAITELSASCDKFKAEMSRAWDEAAIWKRACQANNIVPDEFKDQDGTAQNGDSS